MRDQFIAELTKIAQADERVVLITGDLGFGVLNDYREKLPKQFINAGVAEQAMAGIAAGMALEGHKVFIYSIANFTFMRCLEQLRNDVAYHDLDVNVVSVGGGFSYGQLGMTHHATEDLAIMRCMPTNVVACPCTCDDVNDVTKHIYNSTGLTYLRLDKSAPTKEQLKNNQLQHDVLPRVVRHGNDATIVVSGGILGEAIHAVDQLLAEDIHVRLISIPLIKPLSMDLIVKASYETGAIFTLEEHVVYGGLGSAVSEELMERGSYPKHFERIGLREKFTTVVGDQAFLRSSYGMGSEAIQSRVIEWRKTHQYKKAA